MGSIINRVAIISNQLRRGYLQAGSNAIKRCLSKAGIGLEKVGMLINSGVYPDNYIQEPAFAALLQGKIQKGTDRDLENVFSFDLHEGGGGMIMALRILNGFLNSGKIENGMVVAGDAFDYSALAGTVLLSKGEAGIGFERFSQDTYPEYSDEFNSYTNHIDGELKSFINQSDKYVDHCIVCIEESVANFLSDEQLRLEDIDLIISSRSPAGLTRRLNELYSGDRVSGIDDERELYSAGLVYGLDLAINNHRFTKAKRILFVSVGAGITVSLALYLN